MADNDRLSTLGTRVVISHNDLVSGLLTIIYRRGSYRYSDRYNGRLPVAVALKFTVQS